MVFIRYVEVEHTEDTKCVGFCVLSKINGEKFIELLSSDEHVNFENILCELY